jgi:transcriptional regulator with XRE-family HTH domain
MATHQDPMVQRRRLRVELRKAREAAGLAQRDVAPEMDWSLSKLIRIETGAVGISINDLRALLHLYGITDPDRQRGLLEMAKAAREPAWWSPYKELVSAEFTSFLSYESSASLIRNFESILVPGLLQTEEYARATLAEMVPPVAQPDSSLLGKVDRLVELRMERQDRIAQRSDRPKRFFAMDESVLYRRVGGPDVMRRQLLRLRDSLADPDVVIWIVPFAAGLYQRMRGPFVLFELPNPEENEDILYLENTRGEMIVRNDHDDAVIYLEAFWGMEQIALKNEAAMALVGKATADIPSR